MTGSARRIVGAGLARAGWARLALGGGDRRAGVLAGAASALAVWGSFSAGRSGGLEAVLGVSFAAGADAGGASASSLT